LRVPVADGWRRRLVATTAPAFIFALSVGVPSAAKALSYAGGPGLVAYVTLLAATVWAAQRLPVGAIADSISPRRASMALLVVLLALATAFVVIYPRVTAGSDRDEALDLATRELLRGRFPYSQRAFATGVVRVPGGGNPISPMPGELLLAAPFVLLGSGAWQTFFWLAAFFYVSAAILGSRGRALVALGSMLTLGPAALQEIMTGGDLLANSLWVLVLGALVVGTRATGTAMVSAVLFGVGLSSRAHFLLLLPVLFVVLVQRRGVPMATTLCALALSGFALVTLPFYMRDPAAFSPLHIVGKLRGIDWVLPHTVILASVAGSLLSASVLAARSERRDAAALGASAVVLGIPVILAVVLSCARYGAIGFTHYGWYFISSMPFGVLASFAALPYERGKP
jgi:hypothetical protein